MHEILNSAKFGSHLILYSVVNVSCGASAVHELIRGI